ncbi:MAG: hypothetical protein K2L80_00545 [Muribaculaceae bacterium]|nr:hypothetical protein [Muribaculaceae bacterium]MDE6331069.1 hypothetical protein [Muribaculaceae bacterium]
MDKIKDNIGFVARHYRRGAFSARTAWSRMALAPVPLWRRLKVAASIAAILALAVSAAVVIRHQTVDIRQETQTEIPATASEATAQIKTIDFDNVPLTTVLDRIREVYGAEVVNLPENADEIRLTLHYEGTAADLVDTINEILGTELEVRAD